jgi:hypothetical protein
MGSAGVPIGIETDLLIHNWGSRLRRGCSAPLITGFCKSEGILLIRTVFDQTGRDMLEDDRDRPCAAGARV